MNIIIIFGLFLCIVTSTCSVHHYSVEDFAVEVYVKYNPSCLMKSNFTTIVNVPRGSTVLNLLERSNDLYPTFTEFKVLYLANSTYHLVSLNGDDDAGNCGWLFTTDPETITSSSTQSADLGSILSSPLNSIYITNIGMVVTFIYTSRDMTPGGGGSSSDDIPWTSLDPTLSVEYGIEFTPPCVDPNLKSPSSFSAPVTIPGGSSALNVMETATNNNPSYSFILKNVFGEFYIIDTLFHASTTASCIWCAYFTPNTQSGTPEYLLTADINNFVIPLSGGELTMKYQSSCSFSYDHFARHGPASHPHVPIPPHYNPFMTHSGKDHSCKEKSKGSTGSCKAK
jgi:hypothetical protein